MQPFSAAGGGRITDCPNMGLLLYHKGEKMGRGSGVFPPEKLQRKKQFTSAYFLYIIPTLVLILRILFSPLQARGPVKKEYPPVMAPP